MSHAPIHKCFIWDVVSANSLTKATVIALDESMQFSVEEVGLRDEDLCIYSTSKEVIFGGFNRIMFHGIVDLFSIDCRI